MGTGRLTSNDAGWIGRSEAIGGLGNNQPLSQWIFSAKDGDVSEPIGTSKGIAIAYVEAQRTGGVSPLADVRERVNEDVKKQKAREAARAQLAQFVAGSPNVDAIAAKAGRPAQDATVDRQSPVTGFTGDTTQFVDTALKSNVGQIQGPIVVGDGAVVFQVVEQKKVTPQELTEQRVAFADNLRQQQARNLRTVLIGRLRKAANVEINDTITRPTTTPAGPAGV
jgi:peptidyl-prolyl cis-trans isomerase D